MMLMTYEMPVEESVGDVVVPEDDNSITPAEEDIIPIENTDNNENADNVEPTAEEDISEQVEEGNGE